MEKDKEVNNNENTQESQDDTQIKEDDLNGVASGRDGGRPRLEVF